MDRYVIKYIQGAYEHLWDITNYMVSTKGLFYDKPSTITSSRSLMRSPRRITRPLFR